jgi:hypothetical protein
MAESNLEPSLFDMDKYLSAIKASNRGHTALVSESDPITFAIDQKNAGALWSIQNELAGMSIYGLMSKADEYVQKDVIPQQLAKWRAGLWAKGFKVSHPHAVIDTLYKKFATEWKLPALVMEGMLNLSVMNNACLIWHVKTTGKIQYIRFYNPAMTRIDQLQYSLWCKPDETFSKEVKQASAKEIAEYLKNQPVGSDTQRWVDALRGSTQITKYSGFVQLKNYDKSTDVDHWVLIPGDGGVSQTTYSNVAMQSIFSDIELLRLLVQGDWATAWMIKNMIVLVTCGESITTGPLAGSKANWATSKDVAELKKHFQKVGKAQMLYGNHTIKIEFLFPDPKAFSPEKYQSVIDRVCWFFGIGKYMVLGTSEGGSYSTTSWNVQAVRAEAQRVRELFKTFFSGFLNHPSIVKQIFKSTDLIYDHDCVKEIDKNIIHLSKAYEDLSMENIKSVQYSNDGFRTVENFVPIAVNADNNTIILNRDIPSDKVENLRLMMSAEQALALYGPAEISFDNRIIKDDNTALKELQMLISQGPLSNMELLEQLGFDFDKQVNQKAIERGMWENLVPLFEAKQGILLALLPQVLREHLALVEQAQQKTPGENGRPSTPDPSKQQDTQPRPSADGTS